MNLIISNKGTLDSSLGEITAMGASTKRGDTKLIGQFGTGLKYGIANLLHNRISVKILSGGREIIVGTEPFALKDHAYEMVTINGEKAGFVTELGYKWEIWQAIREIYANAIDEGLLFFGLTDETTYDFNSEATHFIIEATPAIEDLIFNYNKYFCINEEPVWENARGRILMKTGADVRIFYKGFKCMESPEKSIFDYDLYNIDITESRTAKYNWEVESEIHKLIAECDDRRVIRALLSRLREDVYEGQADTLYITPKYSEAWKEELSNAQIFHKKWSDWLNDAEKKITYMLPGAMYNFLISQFGAALKPRSMQFSDKGQPYSNVELSDLESNVFLEALTTLKKGNFNIRYDIKVVDFKNKRILGSVDRENESILISILAVAAGVDEVMNTCIEEYIHLKHGVDDETRGFQTAAITEIVNLIKQRQ